MIADARRPGRRTGCSATGRDQPKWLMPPDRHRDIARGYPRHPETGSILAADVLESVETFRTAAIEATCRAG
jgi:hypothetical protein